MTVCAYCVHIFRPGLFLLFNRGAPGSRGGGPPPRGAPRGAPSRGGPSGRGAVSRGARAAAASSYEGYGSQVMAFTLSLAQSRRL